MTAAEGTAVTVLCPLFMQVAPLIWRLEAECWHRLLQPSSAEGPYLKENILSEELCPFYAVHGIRQIHLGNQFVSQSCTVILSILCFAFIKCIYRPCYVQIVNSLMCTLSSMRESGTALRITGISAQFSRRTF